MPKCINCGKKGFFLKTNYAGLCKECEEEENKRRNVNSEANNLVAKAKNTLIEIKSINVPKDLDRFISGYDTVLSYLQKAATMQKTYSYIDIKENIQEEYDRLAREKQWHIMDGMDILYNEIIGNSKGKYKNYTLENQKWSRETIEILNRNKVSFDSETITHADDIIRKLAFKFHIDMVYVEGNASQNYNIEDMEGHEFESWCAELLRGNGFTAVDVTKGSGDQGVDIIAEKDEIQYAIQCKRYSTDLGNTPIQEVYAGKTLYRCHIGVVMTNSHFTIGAKQLAKATGVLLWDGDKIAKMQATYSKNKEAGKG